SVDALVNPAWRSLADALIDWSSNANAIFCAISVVRRILSALAELPALPAGAPLRLCRRAVLLRWLITRNFVGFVPERDPMHPLGHAYLPLELFAGGALISDLEALARAELLERIFFERIHACPGCGDARLLFREVCS